MNYRIEFSKNALKDLKNIKRNPNYSRVVKNILGVLENDPFTPPYEKLIGNLSQMYSRRINIQHRIVYTVHEDTKTIRILSTWSHYENL